MSAASVAQRLSRIEAWIEALDTQRPVLSPVELMQAGGCTPDPWQQRVLESQSTRQLLLCCRQSGKSFVSAVKALHVALSEPGSLTLLLSPSLRQSQELFRKVLSVYRWQSAIPPLVEESALRLTLPSGSRIISLPGTEGTVRGYSGVRLLVIDEAARVLDELYYAVRPMLSVSQGALLALSTPFGKRGWFHKSYTGGENWERTLVTAHDCPRISQEFLEEERRSLPLLWFKSEYLCTFTDTIDQVFLFDQVQAALSSEVQPLFEVGL